MVDVQCRFIVVDIGATGAESDAGIFENSIGNDIHGVNVNDENAENYVKQQHDENLEATLFSNRSGCYYEMGDYGEHIASLGNHVVSCKYGGIIGVHIT